MTQLSRVCHDNAKKNNIMNVENISSLRSLDSIAHTHIYRSIISFWHEKLEEQMEKGCCTMHHKS